MHKTIAALTILGLTMAGIAHAAGVYRYEKDGKVYYSDQPPANAKVEEVDSMGFTHPLNSSDFKVQDEDGNEDNLQAIRSKECVKAKERLTEYEDSPTLIQRNLKGDELTLTAEERVQVIARAQQDVRDLCGAGNNSEG